ncbi:hypothetical protein CYLTODRAFT_422655 [Cylindrobasidium torrendii FP15055 ss-10]|uniref:Uncharacterized protein n=1 Tax=Cylindrobasidium torrendii FP15055 ss-10 TaxID=1314674 RepID=A0A0D7B9U7_9AGAR|nr:hypothetical protein CYLTODRAFT_422655 [Cylindrobasidium torrendii FP15055 ss-10]
MRPHRHRWTLTTATSGILRFGPAENRFRTTIPPLPSAELHPFCYFRATLRPTKRVQFLLSVPPPPPWNALGENPSSSRSLSSLLVVCASLLGVGNREKILAIKNLGYKDYLGLCFSALDICANALARTRSTRSTTPITQSATSALPCKIRDWIPVCIDFSRSLTLLLRQHWSGTSVASPLYPYLCCIFHLHAYIFDELRRPS